jgi:hypothetical protein
VHIGFGEGLTGAHIDFVIENAVHEFAVLDGATPA